MNSMDRNAPLYEDKIYYTRNIGPYQLMALPWWAKTPEPTYPVRRGCRIEPLVCGERVFGQIAIDLAAAKRSVDIITWGFDPGMFLVREERANKGMRYGDLLLEIATREKDPVAVRLIIWHDSSLTQALMKNMPGYYGSWATHFISEINSYYSEEHQNYNVEWFKTIMKNSDSNIELRVRDIPLSCLAKALSDEEVPKNMTATALKFFPTHHQKMMLIDYESKVSAIGYVMGHNSITDYWDTKAHKFHDPRRERVYKNNPAEAWNQGPDLTPTFPGYTPTQYEIEQKELAVRMYLEKNSSIAIPYQDISCRVCGPVLFDLNHNFCQAWSESKRPLSLIAEILKSALESTPAGMAGKIAKEKIKNKETDFIKKRRSIRAEDFLHWKFESSVQLMRTHPMHGEKTIKECYANINRLMGHYLFIQNQYVQYKDWIQHLEECIQKRRKAGYNEPFYIFILTSKPERNGMDLATYDVAYRVGYSENMPVIHAQGAEKIQSGTMELPLRPHELEQKGINVVMASLWTCAKGSKLLPSEYEEIYIHAKVAIVDDAAFTMGSANLNLRSMAIDSELNIASDSSEVAYALRRELFEQCSGTPGPARFENMEETYKHWRQISIANRKIKEKGGQLLSQLVEFYVDRKPGSPVV